MRDKADIKKCVVAGPSLTICHGGPMHAYHCHGYQRGLLSGDCSIKTANAGPCTHKTEEKPAFNSQVTLAIDSAN